MRATTGPIQELGESRTCHHLILYYIISHVNEGTYTYLRKNTIIVEMGLTDAH